jgi:hypothetical protein
VTIPKSVTAIGASAFEGCTALATVVLSDNIKLYLPYFFTFFKKKEKCIARFSSNAII